VFGVKSQPMGQQRGGGGSPPSSSGKPQSNSINYQHWQAVADQLKSMSVVDYQGITIQDGKASVSLSGLGNSRAADSYAFDAHTGDITETTYYKDADRAGKVRGWVYAVHVGSWGGVVTRILNMLAALLGATLPLTGYYLWIKRWWQKRKKRLPAS
jgi:uncharacterized iron-regulated membrane protein